MQGLSFYGIDTRRNIERRQQEDQPCRWPDELLAEEGIFQQVEQRQYHKASGGGEYDVPAGLPGARRRRKGTYDVPNSDKEEQSICKVKSIGDELMPVVVAKAEIKNEGRESEDASNKEQAVLKKRLSFHATGNGPGFVA